MLDLFVERGPSDLLSALSRSHCEYLQLIILLLYSLQQQGFDEFILLLCEPNHKNVKNWMLICKIGYFFGKENWML